MVIKITKEEFPVISTVRYRDLDNKDKSAEYFGPYPAGDMLKKSLRYIRKIIPFRDCSTTKFNSHQKIEKRCLFGDLNLCAVPCESKLSAKEYQKNIKLLKDFLRGKKKNVANTLIREMKKLSKQKNYEEAKIYRDRLSALEHIDKVAVGLRDDMVRPENILFRRIECYDISNISGQYAVGSMIVFSNGEKDKDQYRKFRIKQQKYCHSEPMKYLGEESQRSFASAQDDSKSYIGDVGAIKEILIRRFKNDWPKPDLIVIDGGISQLNIAQLVLHSMKIKIPVLSIAKGEKRMKNEFHYSRPELGKYLQKNIDLQRVVIKARNEAHRFAITYYRKLHTKNMLNDN